MDAVITVIIAVSLLMIMLLMKLPLYIILAVVPVISALIYGGLTFLGHIFITAIQSGVTWGLVLNVFAVGWLVSLYRSLLIVDRLGKELSKAFKNDLLALTIVPGAIGLLPVAGGALMSAPIVDSIGSEVGLSKAKKNFVNVWYRHVLVYVYPLSSLIIITASLFEISIAKLVVDQLIMAAIMFIIGLPIIGLKISKRNVKANKIMLLRDFSPILSSVLMAFILSPIDEYFPIARISVTIAALLGIFVFVIAEKATLSDVKNSFKDVKLWEITLISFEVMVFRTLFSEMDLSPLVNLIASSRINKSLLVLVIPLFLSFISGTSSGGIAISAPILQSIVGSSKTIADLVYASSFIGYLGSPLHLCFVYSSEYFGVSMKDTYKYMVPASLASLIAAWILSQFIW
ncbi:MAG TPA: DUF401 family protein [Euryarchaeota archaeon]|nr:DUF401 family protein [Euryarchaeota archaeon]